MLLSLLLIVCGESSKKHKCPLLLEISLCYQRWGVIRCRVNWIVQIISFFFFFRVLSNLFFAANTPLKTIEYQLNSVALLKVPTPGIFANKYCIWKYDWSSQLCTQLLKQWNKINTWTWFEPCDTGAVLYQLLVTRDIPVEVEDYKWMYAESSYIWSSENDMKVWWIIAVIHTA